MDGKAVRQSGRLAAKASKGLSSLDKAKLVLMKKSGICPEDGAQGKEALEKYRGLFKQELPTSFMEVVSALLDSSRQGGGLVPGAGTAVSA